MLSGNPYLDRAEQIKQMLLALQLRYAQGAGQQPQQPKADYGRMAAEFGKSYLKDQAIKKGAEAAGTAIGIGGTASAGAGALPGLSAASAGATPGLMLPSLAPAVPGAVGTGAATGAGTAGAVGANAGLMSVLGPAIVAAPIIYGALQTSGGGFSQEHKARGRMRDQLRASGLLDQNNKLNFSDGSSFDVGLEGRQPITGADLARKTAGMETPRSGKFNANREWFGVDFTNPLADEALSSANIAAAKIAGNDPTTRRAMAGYFTNALLQNADNGTLGSRSKELLAKFGAESEADKLAELVRAQDSELIAKETADGRKGQWTNPGVRDLYSAEKPMTAGFNIKRFKAMSKYGPRNEWGPTPTSMDKPQMQMPEQQLVTRDWQQGRDAGSINPAMLQQIQSIGSRLGAPPLDLGRLSIQPGGGNQPSAGVTAVPQQSAAPVEPKRKWYPSLGKYLDNPNYRG